MKKKQKKKQTNIKNKMKTRKEGSKKDELQKKTTFQLTKMVDGAIFITFFLFMTLVFTADVMYYLLTGPAGHKS
jgi:hypothetical protein